VVYKPMSCRQDQRAAVRNIQLSYTPSNIQLSYELSYEQSYPPKPQTLSPKPGKQKDEA